MAALAFGIAIQKAQQLVAEREGFASAVESPILSWAEFPEPRASDVVNVFGTVRVGDQPTDSDTLVIVDILSAHDFFQSHSMRLTVFCTAIYFKIVFGITLHFQNRDFWKQFPAWHDLCEARPRLRKRAAAHRMVQSFHDQAR
jgi:hypothetical protein